MVGEEWRCPRRSRPLFKPFVVSSIYLTKLRHAQSAQLQPAFLGRINGSPHNNLSNRGPNLSFSGYGRERLQSSERY